MYLYRIKDEIEGAKIFLYLGVFFLFFNSFMLPNGFSYTMLATPIFAFLIQRKGVSLLKIGFIYFMLFIPFFCLHSLNGISTKDYLVSCLVYSTIVVFILAANIFIKTTGGYLGIIFEKAAYVNIYLVIIAVLSLPIDSISGLFWYSNEITELLGGYKRLKLLTTESSVYSLILVPLFFYFFQFFIHSKLSKKQKLLLYSIIVSLLLSLSYGVIGVTMLTIATCIVFFKKVQMNGRFKSSGLIFKLLFFGIVASLILITVFPDSGVVVRLSNILAGTDTSVKGRTSDSFFLAQKVIETKSEIIGIGPGQLKIFGRQIFDNFYQYSLDLTSERNIVVRIPNAVADTLVTFGYLGLALRFLILLVLFVKTKVYNSSYRSCIFVFMFIFQFFGSNITDINAYFLWVVAFSNAFPNSYFQLPTYTKSV